MTQHHVTASRPGALRATEPATFGRTPSVRRYAMTPPAFFAVEYAINPWMDVTKPVDVDLAQAQWESLYETYLRLGHRVDVIEPVAGLPDMVYAANGGFIAQDTAIVARFRYAERAGESRAYGAWMSSLGYRPVVTRHVNEGQGDLL
jgi:N-dimethylarginine dimethylaminohydrolase